MLIAQITDCHIVEPGSLVADRIDSSAGLHAALDRLHEIAPRPALIVATGDLVNDGRPEQYDHLAAIFDRSTIPIVPLPGNHDDRTELRRRFADVLPQGGPDEPIDHLLDVGPLRLVFLDTQVPGSNAGRVLPAQSAWLDGVLGDAPDRPTVVFMHHPPFATGIAFMDRDPFDGAPALEKVIAAHPQVALVSCGHLHRVVQHRFGNTLATTWPSTSVQLDLVLDGGPVTYTTEPLAVAVHHWDAAAGLRSHLLALGDVERWTPAWARALM